jgi:hypothetical protein
MIATKSLVREMKVVAVMDIVGFWTTTISEGTHGTVVRVGDGSIDVLWQMRGGCRESGGTWDPDLQWTFEATVSSEAIGIV